MQYLTNLGLYDLLHVDDDRLLVEVYPDLGEDCSDHRFLAVRRDRQDYRDPIPVAEIDEIHALFGICSLVHLLLVEIIHHWLLVESVEVVDYLPEQLVALLVGFKQFQE